MKKLISNYTFEPVGGTVTFTDYDSIELESVLLITNVTSNEIIYNFASPALGGVVAGNVLNLTLDTSSMSAADAIQIFYEDTDINVATNETLDLLQEQNLLMRRLLKISEALAVVDASQRQRVVVEGTVAIATNQAIRIIDNTSSNVYATQGNSVSVIVTIPEFWKFVEAGRLSYQQCIRANLTFSA